MKYLTMILFSFIVVTALPQSQKIVEPATLECKYIYTEVRDTISMQRSKDEITVLRVGKEVSQFFSMAKFSADSLLGKPDGRKLWGKQMVDAIEKGKLGNLPWRSTFKDYIYKNYPKGKLTNFTSDGLMTLYRCEEVYEKQEWMLIDSTKQIIGYTCQLAKTNFRGRQYWAWFTLDIPVSDGPWKFNGLPGLILEVYDSADHYHFTAVGISADNLTPVTLYNTNEKYEKAGRIELLRERYEILFGHRNVNAEIEAMSGIKINEDKVERSALKRNFYDFMERDFR